MIEAKNLSKKYKSFVAVDDITFKVNPGEIFAFLGPNGAGKTTTIKMLTTLVKPSTGQVFVNNFNSVTESHKARQSFGIVFQDESTDDELTAFENMDFHGVIYGLKKKERAEKIEKLLKFVELWDRKDSLVKNFSGGMRRRLEIARGLMHEPKVLFLDEPTLGLDPQTRNHIWDYILNLSKNKGLTVFFTTHYMEEAEKYADRIAIIDKGKIIARGTNEELKEKTRQDSLEKAFLTLTGYDIREAAAADPKEHARKQRKQWKR